MIKIGQVWKCEVCGNIVEIVHEGAGLLVCCGQGMVLQEEKTKEQEGEEKHIPIIEGNKVKVGEVEHPMTEEHYIEWIEVEGEKGFKVKVFFKLGDKPEKEFCFKPVKARAYCNVHGLWKT